MKQEHGFTMVELLIAVAISGVAMTGIYMTQRSQQNSYISQEQTVVMQQNLRAGMYFLQKAIRMAGFDLSEDSDATITTAGIDTIEFTRRYTETFRDLDNSGAQNGAEPYVDYNGNGNWDEEEEFAIQYFLADSDGDGVNDTLASNAGGLDLWIADNIQDLGFAYAFDRDPLDGQLDMEGGNTIWGVDTDGDGTLDLNLDTNLDGNIDTADDTDGDGIIDGRVIGGPTVNPEDIRAVRIWLLARAQRSDDNFFNNMEYVVANQVITSNDNFRRELMIMDVKCRNMGL